MIANTMLHLMQHSKKINIYITLHYVTYDDSGHVVHRHMCLCEKRYNLVRTEVG